jgi:hypothetical protein
LSRRRYRTRGDIYFVEVARLIDDLDLVRNSRAAEPRPLPRKGWGNPCASVSIAVDDFNPEASSHSVFITRACCPNDYKNLATQGLPATLVPVEDSGAVVTLVFFKEAHRRFQRDSRFGADSCNFRPARASCRWDLWISAWE